MTMKQWVINCLAIYGAYRLAKDFIEDNFGIEIKVKNKNDIPEVKKEEKKGFSFTISR